MRARRAPISALVAVVLALLVAGCSLDEDEQKAADSLEPALVTNTSGEAERDSAECVAETWVGEVGTDRLVKAELLTRGLEARRAAVREVLAGERPVSHAVAAGLAVSRLACADFDAISLDRKKEHPKASAEDLDEYADCLKDIDRDDWEKSLTAFYSGKEATGLDAFRKDLKACNDMLEATDE
jgi:hypothetical protein